MADTLNRQSPLQGWGKRFGDLPEAARISEEPFVAMVDLWVDPGAAGGAAAAGGARDRSAADDSVDRYRQPGSQRDLVRASGVVDLLHQPGR